MSTTITGKLNNNTRSHETENSTMFFISIGKQEYDRTIKEKVWVNYDVALFAKDGQINYYKENLNAGAIVSCSGSGLIIRLDETGQYPPKLELLDAKLVYLNSDMCQKQAQPQQPAFPQSQHPPQQAQQGQPRNMSADVPGNTFVAPQQQQASFASDQQSGIPF